MTKYPIILLVPCLALLAFGALGWSKPPAARVVKVGIYQSEPLVFWDDARRPAGLCVDILTQMARREDWEFDYVPCEWPSCLEQLERGELDLLPAIAYSEEKGRRFDFNGEMVIQDWGNVYTRPEVTLDSFQDLDGRRVAVVKGDDHHRRLHELVRGFGCTPDFLEVSGLAEMLASIAQGDAEAGVVSRFAAARFEGFDSLHKAPLVFGDSRLYFAAVKSGQHDLIEALDRHLAEWKRDNGSVYYRALARWLCREGAWSPPVRFPHILAAVTITGGVVLISGALLKKTRKLPGRSAGLEREVSKRLRAEQALLASEQNYRRLYQEYEALVEGIPDSLILFGPDLRAVRANQGAKRRFGAVGQEFIGRSCKDLWAAPDGKCIVEECFQSAKNIETEMTDREGRTWGVNVFPIRHQSSAKVLSVVMLASDITEKVRLREETIRAGRLSSLGELSAAVAHEINNPNALILLNAPVVRDFLVDVLPILDAHWEARGEFSAAGLDYSEIRGEIVMMLTEILESARRIKGIVKDLKDFARPPSGDFSEEFDFNAPVQAAVRLVGNVIRKATDRFEETYVEGLPRARGNFQRLEQVVVNLLMNACQALPGRERGIFVSTRHDLQRRLLILEVRDEGVGIDPEKLSELTNPFFTTRREAGGTGLGLSISARIVQNHKGRLTFESRAGEGMKVTLELPVVKEETP